jgi:hypothetical protein
MTASASTAALVPQRLVVGAPRGESAAVGYVTGMSLTAESLPKLDVVRGESEIDRLVNLLRRRHTR